ncbi:MAG: hypothetical protein AB8H79_23770 [Myxococcota bacterium]
MLTIESDNTHRPTLGDNSSIVCFKACVRGLEEALGTRAALVSLRAAGRKRGRSLVASLNLDGTVTSPEQAAAPLRTALGADGTRLCIVEDITKEGEDVYVVKLSETICSCLEEQGSKAELSYTFGAVQGAIESLIGEKVRGKQVESVLRGGQYDSLRFEIFR